MPFGRDEKGRVLGYQVVADGAVVAKFAIKSSALTAREHAEAFVKAQLPKPPRRMQARYQARNEALAAHYAQSKSLRVTAQAFGLRKNMVREVIIAHYPHLKRKQGRPWQ